MGCAEIFKQSMGARKVVVRPDRIHRLVESIIGLLKKFKNSGSGEDWKKGEARRRKGGAKEEEGGRQRRGKGGGKEENGEGKDAREEVRVKGGKTDRVKGRRKKGSTDIIMIFREEKEKEMRRKNDERKNKRRGKERRIKGRRKKGEGMREWKGRRRK